MIILLPRILAIAYIAFLCLMALDIFNIGFFSWPERVIAFIMHLIPAFLAAICLVVAWKRPVIGGGLFLALAVGFTIFFRTYSRLDVFLPVSGSLIVIGSLFILSERLSRRNIK